MVLILSRLKSGLLAPEQRRNLDCSSEEKDKTKTLRSEAQVSNFRSVRAQGHIFVMKA
jgi:hypothetical protein